MEKHRDKNHVLGGGWVEEWSCAPVAGGRAGARWEVWVQEGCSPGDTGAAALLPSQLGGLACLSPGFDLAGDFRCLPAYWLPGNPATVLGWL